MSNLNFYRIRDLEPDEELHYPKGEGAYLSGEGAAAQALRDRIGYAEERDAGSDPDHRFAVIALGMPVAYYEIRRVIGPEGLRPCYAYLEGSGRELTGGVEFSCYLLDQRRIGSGLATLLTGLVLPDLANRFGVRWLLGEIHRKNSTSQAFVRRLGLRPIGRGPAPGWEAHIGGIQEILEAVAQTRLPQTAS
ncbi:MAG: hypothetical protein U1E65_22680 [Myxococcota bacterium]